MKQKRIQDWMTPQEFAKVIDKTYLPHHRAAFALGFWCGLRISEVTNLKPEHIRRNENMIKVVQGKNQKDRLVPYPRQLVKHFSLLPIKVSHRALQIAFRKAVQRAGIKKDLHFHSLRHSFCTNLINKGVGYKTVQVLAGHSSISTTMDIYGHMTIEQHKKELEDKVYG